MKRLYLVGALIQERDVAMGPLKATIKMEWADGQIGVLPVFSNKKAAQKYAMNKFQVLTFEVESLPARKSK